MWEKAILTSKVLSFIQDRADTYKRTVEVFQVEYEKAAFAGDINTATNASERVLRALVAYNAILEVREGILKINQDTSTFFLVRPGACRPKE